MKASTLVVKRLDAEAAAWRELRAKLSAAPAVEARRLVDEIRRDLAEDWPERAP